MHVFSFRSDKKPKLQNAPSGTVYIRRYVKIPDLFETSFRLPIGSGDEVQLIGATKVRTRESGVQLVHHNVARFDCGSVAGDIDALFNLNVIEDRLNRKVSRA